LYIESFFDSANLQFAALQIPQFSNKIAKTNFDMIVNFIAKSVKITNE
jgi:hypothetical protein